MVLADGHVLRHVAAGLAKEPDGSAVDGEAEAGTNETAAVGPGSRCRVVYHGKIRGLRHCGHRPIWPFGVGACLHRPIWPIGGESSQWLSLLAGPGYDGCAVQNLSLKIAQRLGLPTFEPSILRGPAKILVEREWRALRARQHG